MNKKAKNLEETVEGIVIEKLPPGICQGAIETYPERFIPSRLIYASYLVGSKGHKGNRLKKRTVPFYKGKVK